MPRVKSKLDLFSKGKPHGQEGGKGSFRYFLTSFLPVATFKIIARVGDATWGQAQVAVVVGFILALVQYVSARKILKYNTYLEVAFLVFLLAGTIWVYALPETLAHFFVDNSVPFFISRSS